MGWPINQEAYQIEVHERITRQLIYDSGVVHSAESQLISLPHLAPNVYGYTWHVRIAGQGQEKKGKGKTRGSDMLEWSDWSQEQTLRVVPADLRTLPTNRQAPISTPQWIGAISKRDAHIPTGRWSNEVFKKDTFLTQWDQVDSLSSRSIILRKGFRASHAITDAVVYVCGLGHYEMSINGGRVLSRKNSYCALLFASSIAIDTALWP